MKKLAIVLMLTLALAISVGVSSSAANRGTPAEAKALLKKAVAHYQSVGRKQALADFTGGKAPFVDRDLYVFCIGPDRILSANGGFPRWWAGRPMC